MDGPVIQQAVDVAVRAGVGMRDVLRAVEAVAAAGAVAVVMTYWNPIERYGVDAVRRPTWPRPGERGDHPRPDPGRGRPSGSPPPSAAGLDRVFLVAPSSTEARLRSTTAACRGFVYAASTMGVTGTRVDRRRRRRDAGGPHPGGRPDLRCASGWRLDGDQAAEVAAFADGVIVGSAYVRELLEGRGRRRRPARR